MSSVTLSFVALQIEINLLTKEHADVFMEKVAEVIQIVKENPVNVPPDSQTQSTTFSIVNLNKRIEMRELEREEAGASSDSTSKLKDEADPRVCFLQNWPKLLFVD